MKNQIYLRALFAFFCKVESCKIVSELFLVFCERILMQKEIQAPIINYFIYFFMSFPNMLWFRDNMGFSHFPTFDFSKSNFMQFVIKMAPQ